MKYSDDMSLYQLLTPKERDCLRRMHLCGMDIFNDKDRPDCKTVKSLSKKGCFDRNGLSPKGKIIAQYISDKEHAKVVGI